MSYSKSSNRNCELLKIQQERASDGVVKREREGEREREVIRIVCIQRKREAPRESVTV